MMKKVIKKLEKINKNAEIILPSSKSYLNRALIVTSIHQGKTKLTNISNICDDVNDLILVLKSLGVKMEINNDEKLNKTITIIGNNGIFIEPKDKILNCGLGGTTTRFLLGLSLLFDFDITITATGKMLERPVNHLINVIKLLGKNVEYLKKDNCLPVRISGKINKNIDNIEINCSESSQFLTAILLIAHRIGLKTIIAKNLVSKPYINITKDILKHFRINVQFIPSGKDLICKINKENNHINKITQIPIEIDWSSASYFLALGFLFNENIKIKSLNSKSSQGDIEFLKVLSKIQKFKSFKNVCLKINMKNMPDVSMTAMIICAFQDFNTKITGLETLKNKECDRLKAMHDELDKIGINTEITKEYNAITIYGNSKLQLKKDIEIETYNDHRIAMCFAIVGIKLGHILIKNPNVVNKSFPNFWQELDKLYLDN